MNDKQSYISECSVDRLRQLQVNPRLQRQNIQLSATIMQQGLSRRQKTT